METTINSYNSKVDSKRRITLRNSNYEYYSVKEYKSGKIILEPRVLVSPFEISENTLETIKRSVENVKKGKISKALKLDVQTIYNSFSTTRNRRTIQ